MHVSKDGLDLIKRNEGCKLRAYLCPAGVWTIGYGSTGSHVKPNSVITKAEAEALLIKDLSRFENGVLVAVAPVTPLVHEFDAMVSLAFNIGLANFEKSSVCKLYRTGKKVQAANAFSMWNKAKVNGVLTPLAGLTKRRSEEKQLFLSATPPVTVDRPINASQRLVALPEESVVPEAPKGLHKSREIWLGSGLGVGGVIQTVQALTGNEWGQVKTGVEQVGHTLTGGVWDTLHVPEITGLLAGLIGIFMIYKRYKDRKDGVR
jgi:lysozyme